MLDRYGNEIIISNELKSIIDNIKELPKDKIKDVVSLLNYSYPQNIIYFGYANHCYDLKDMEKISEFFSCYCYVNFKNYDDHIKVFNHFLDKLGLTEKIYKEHKEFIQSLNGYMLDKYNNYIQNLDNYNLDIGIVEESKKYTFENRKGYAYLNYFNDYFDPYQVIEYINDNNYYYATLNFEHNIEYQKLDYYIYKKYHNEYENTDNEVSLIFDSIYVSILKNYEYSIEKTEENQIFVLLGDINKEKLDLKEYVNDDEEDKIIFFSNNISTMLEFANKLSNHYLDNEEEIRSIIDE